MPVLRGKMKSCFWNFFNEIKAKEVYECKSCRQYLKSHNQYGNLKRHIRRKHKLQYKIIMEYIHSKATLRGRRRQTGWVFKYCKHVIENKYRCNVCCRELSMSRGCGIIVMGNMIRHIEKLHPYIYNEETKDTMPEHQTKVLDFEFVDEIEKSKNETHVTTDDEHTEVEQKCHPSQADKITCLEDSQIQHEAKLEDGINDSRTDENIEANADSEEHRPATLHFSQRKRRSWVYKYCVQVTENKFKCNECCRILNMSINIGGVNMSNMVRHIKKLHSFIYNVESKETPEANLFEGLDFEFVEDVETSKTCVNKCHMSCTCPVTTDDEMKNVKSKVKQVVEQQCNPPETEERMHLEGLQSQHEAIIEGVEMIDTETDENIEARTETIVPKHGPETEKSLIYLNETDDDYENKVRVLCQMPLPKGRSRNCFWNFFNVIKENEIYQCKSCERRIKSRHGNLGNMKRHICNKHKIQYEIIMDYIKSQGGLDSASEEYYFMKIADDRYKCKTCKEIIMSTHERQTLLTDIYVNV